MESHTLARKFNSLFWASNLRSIYKNLNSYMSTNKLKSCLPFNFYLIILKFVPYLKYFSNLYECCKNSSEKSQNFEICSNWLVEVWICINLESNAVEWWAWLWLLRECPKDNTNQKTVNGRQTDRQQEPLT